MIDLKWMTIRKIGIMKCSLLYGSLFWGGICATASVIPLILLKKTTSFYIVLIYYLVWIIGGFYFGKTIWMKKEKAS